MYVLIYIFMIFLTFLGMGGGGGVKVFYKINLQI